MAFGQGQTSTEGGSIKRYIGVASVNILALNPSKEELEKIYNRTLENELEYTGETENTEGNKVPFVRLDFIVKADPEKYEDNDHKPINLVNKVTFFLRRALRTSRDNKIQVIDKYGRTAWVTMNQLEEHIVPEYASGPANIDKDYRPAYIGEEELTKFLIAYLNIPACQRYIEGKWVMNAPEKLSDSEARLEMIENYFKGDLSELKEILRYQPNNKVKVLFGIRTTEEGRQYQTVYTRMFLKNNVTNYSGLAKDVNQTQEAGGLSTSEFMCTDLHEYVVKSTTFEQPEATVTPSEDAGQNFWNSIMA